MRYADPIPFTRATPASMPSPPEILRLTDAIAGVYRGNRPAVDLLVIAFIAGGHVLLEDIPGVGKTTLARALAQATGGGFKRLQCTPDLMPADITGVSIFDDQDRKFVFHPGPLFCDVLLADELNRTPPRTQSALLEALSEGQVTVEGTAMPLAKTFFCIATQNPLDHAGTYPLPDSQRDRFLMTYKLGYPEGAAEYDLLSGDGAEQSLARLTPAMDLATARRLREQARTIRVEESVRRYLLAIVQATRGHKAVQVGASPRAALGLQRACQARALIQNRAFVIPDDVQALAAVTLAHRISARMGQSAHGIIQGLVESLPVPR